MRGEGIAPQNLIIICRELEIALRMSANGADLGSVLANHEVTTVAALPDAVAFA